MNCTSSWARDESLRWEYTRSETVTMYLNRFQAPTVYTLIDLIDNATIFASLGSYLSLVHKLDDQLELPVPAANGRASSPRPGAMSGPRRDPY